MTRLLELAVRRPAMRDFRPTVTPTLPPYPNLRPLPLRIRRADNEERKRLTLCAATRRLSPASDLIGVGATCGLLEKEVGQFRCQTLAKASMAASRVVTADGEDAA